MDSLIKPLNQISVGGMGRVDKIQSTGKLRRRMLDLGIVKGTIIEVLHSSPSGDPMAYSIRGAVIALRSEDAEKIMMDINNKQL